MSSNRENILETYRKTKSRFEPTPIDKITKESFPLLISPGAEEVAEYLQNKKDVGPYTNRQNTVLVISNGSHVHGHGDIGPQAVLPILEAKALVLKQFGGITAVPLPVALTESDELVELIEQVTPACGAVLLEGFSEAIYSNVFEALAEKSTVPVIESSRHGLSVALLAGLINAHAVVKKNPHHSRIAIFGTGPITTSFVHLLHTFVVGDVVVVDRDGILHPLRTNIEGEKEWLAQETNKEMRTGGALEAVTGADVVVSISKSGPLKEEYIRMMAQKAIVFALREPEPEITPSVAKKAGADVVATKSFSFQNYVTDAIVLPYVLRAILDKAVLSISNDVRIEIAKTIAQTVTNPTRNRILPTVFDRRIAKQIANLF